MTTENKSDNGVERAYYARGVRGSKTKGLRIIVELLNDSNRALCALLLRRAVSVETLRPILPHMRSLILVHRTAGQ